MFAFSPQYPGLPRQWAVARSTVRIPSHGFVCVADDEVDATGDDEIMAINVAGADALSSAQALASLETVLSSISRLEDKVDALSKKVDAIISASPAAAPADPTAAAPSGPTNTPTAPATPASPATPATPEAAQWDGNVDEGAWFDADDDDMPDWRDVRRLNKLL